MQDVTFRVIPTIILPSFINNFQKTLEATRELTPWGRINGILTMLRVELPQDINIP